MKPTRAPEMRLRTPSSIPSPARRIGQTATFLPEIRWTVVRSSGVSISISSVARPFVASYVRRSVTSSTSWRKRCVGVESSRSIPSLCWTSGWSTTTTALCAAVVRVSGSFIGRVAAETRVQRPLFAKRFATAAQGIDLRFGAERTGDDLAHLAQVALVEPAHGHRGCAEAHAGRLHRRALVEGNGVSVGRDLHLVELLLRGLARPVAGAEVHLQEVRVGSAGEDVEPVRQECLGERVRIHSDL